MRYVARNPIKYRDNGKVRLIAPGRTVPEDLVDDDLIACGAIEEVGDDADDAPAEPAAKPLGKMNRAELDAVLAAEAVDAASARTNAEIVAAIEAHRARGQGAYDAGIACFVIATRERDGAELTELLVLRRL